MHPVSCSRSNIWQAESIEVVAFAHAHLFAVVRVLVVVTDKVQQPVNDIKSQLGIDFMPADAGLFERHLDTYHQFTN
jgi:hypothetical protein